MKINKPRNAQEAARQAIIAQRASHIAEEMKKGGEYVAYEQTPGVYNVTKRSFTSAADSSYIVDLTPPKPTCSCPDFAKNMDYCKHTVGLQMRLEADEEAAQVEAMEFRAEEDANADF